MKFLKYLVASALVVACGLASAQSWPTKQVRIVVGYGAGGPGDIIARALAIKLAAAWGQPVVVDNKPGANEIVAAIDVTKQPGDGHTLILGTDALYSFNQLLRSKPGYDAAKDFAPIGRLGQSPLGFLCGRTFPPRTSRSSWLMSRRIQANSITRPPASAE